MEVSVQSQPASYVVWEETVQRVLTKALADLNLADAELSVLLTDNPTIADLNKTYRGQDRPTDVLSFSQREGDLANPDDPLLGDIVISIDRALEQAQDYGHSPEREVAFLAVHGLLHLLGYDHEVAEDERVMMDRTEAILAPLGLTRR